MKYFPPMDIFLYNINRYFFFSLARLDQRNNVLCHTTEEMEYLPYGFIKKDGSLVSIFYVICDIISCEECSFCYFFTTKQIFANRSTSYEYYFFFTKFTQDGGFGWIGVHTTQQCLILPPIQCLLKTQLLRSSVKRLYWPAKFQEGETTGINNKRSLKINNFFFHQREIFEKYND